MVKIIMLCYVLFLINKMVGFKENFIDHINLAQNFDELGSVEYESMNINVVPVLINSKTLKSIELNEETRSYITLHFHIESYDISDGNDESYRKPAKEEMEAQVCTEKDFDRTKLVV